MNFLNYDQAKNILSWHEAIEALRLGHEKPKATLHDSLIGPKDGMLLNRMARIEGLGYGIKAESVFNGNTSIGLPNTHGVVIVYSSENGILRGLVDSHIITDLKTAADSVLGATLLARPDSKHLVIIGAGRVAHNLAHAYSALFPKLKKISIWSRRLNQSQALAKRLEGLSAPVVAASDLQLTLSTADIVSAATMAQQPILKGDWIRSGTHIDLIGAFTPEMREADDQLIASSQLYVDNLETTWNIGEIVIPIVNGKISRDHIRGDLYRLVNSSSENFRNQKDITVFKNGGGAHLDLMVADAMLKKLGL
ncbi:ornithine cyclodeaminase family protein [Acinetobacter nematophilus]|uniref:Ornithine cyclodeaminase n=1 Tax=Acinetobacter nematophilus TaxID=2994642 RepID=A0A9X3IGJ6_9GAMM|nr:ornithine cyclodeaminase [Acinetobacter nematophilus]MCX5466855.1 ornithine cyclodeaminase [Acinetobacter nematophilus]